MADSMPEPLIWSIILNRPSDAPNVLIGARRTYRLEGGSQESLRGLLQRACMRRPHMRPLNATDPSDKIYGILGFTPKTKQLGIVPNYSKSTQEVYTEVARALICHGETSFLAWCQQPRGLEGLLSWVPNFSSPIRDPCAEDRLFGSLFSASGRQQHSKIIVVNHHDPRVPAISGTQVDTISSTGSPWMPIVDSPFDYDAAQRLITEIAAFCKQSQELDSVISRNETLWSEATWRIPCADRECKEFTSRRASQTSLEGFIESKSLGEDHSQEVSWNRQGYQIEMECQHK